MLRRSGLDGPGSLHHIVVLYLLQISVGLFTAHPREASQKESRPLGLGISVIFTTETL